MKVTWGRYFWTGGGAALIALVGTIVFSYRDQHPQVVALVPPAMPPVPPPMTAETIIPPAKEGEPFRVTVDILFGQPSVCETPMTVSEVLEFVRAGAYAKNGFDVILATEDQSAESKEAANELSLRLETLGIFPHTIYTGRKGSIIR